MSGRSEQCCPISQKFWVLSIRMTNWTSRWVKPEFLKSCNNPFPSSFSSFFYSHDFQNQSQIFVKTSIIHQNKIPTRLNLSKYQNFQFQFQITLIRAPVLISIFNIKFPKCRDLNMVNGLENAWNNKNLVSDEGLYHLAFSSILLRRRHGLGTLGSGEPIWNITCINR